MYNITVICESNSKIILYPLIKLALRLKQNVIVSTNKENELNRLALYKNSNQINNLTLTNVSYLDEETINNLFPSINTNQTIVISNVWQPYTDEVVLFCNEGAKVFKEQLAVRLCNSEVPIKEINFGVKKKVVSESLEDAETYWKQKGINDANSNLNIENIGKLTDYVKGQYFDDVEENAVFYGVSKKVTELVLKLIPINLNEDTVKELTAYMTKPFKLIEEVNTSEDINNGSKRKDITSNSPFNFLLKKGTKKRKSDK